MNKDSKLPKENLRPKIKHDIKQEYSDDSDNDSSVSLVTDGSCQSSSSKELCPICLCSFKNQQLAKSDVCEHKFCLECLQEWSKKTNTCPIDRKVFKSIRSLDGTIVIKTEDKQQQNFFEEIDDVTYCQICNRCDREDILLLCDGCDQGYHIECLTPPLSHIPIGNWFCVGCTLNRQRESRRQLRELSRAEQTTSRLRQSLTLVRPFVRTRFSERVRSTVNQGRIERGAYIVVSESETDEDFDTDQDDDSDTDQDDEDVDEEFIDEEYVDESPELPKNTSIDDSITSAIERCLNTPIVPIQRSSTIKLKRTISFKRRKRRSTKKVRRRRRTTTKITIAEDGSKVKTKVIRRKKQRRKRYRRVKRSIPSVQERIINSIQKTQLVAKISRDTVPITLNSIELERLTENKKDKIRGTCFPKRAQPWFQTSILNEIDEYKNIR